MMRVLSIIGTILTLVFVAIIVKRGIGDLPRLELSHQATWLWLGAAISLYTLSQVIGSMAWRITLGAYGSVLNAGRAESQLLVSQIGKYIPGNVAHLFGRFALARTDGLAAGVIGAAMLVEVSMLIGVTFLLSGGLLLVLPEFRLALGQELGDAVAGRVAILFPILLITTLILSQILLWRRAGSIRPKVRNIVIATMLHMLNFIGLGISLWCVACAIFPASGVGPLASTAIFTAAWVAGFLMPGSPGGIGIRDGILALGLGLFIGEGTALGVAVGHRAISTLGDIVTFGAGLALRQRTKIASKLHRNTV